MEGILFFTKLKYFTLYKDNFKIDIREMKKCNSTETLMEYNRKYFPTIMTALSLEPRPSTSMKVGSVVFQVMNYG